MSALVLNFQTKRLNLIPEVLDSPELKNKFGFAMMDLCTPSPEAASLTPASAVGGKSPPRSTPAARDEKAVGCVCVGRGFNYSTALTRWIGFVLLVLPPSQAYPSSMVCHSAVESSQANLHMSVLIISQKFCQMRFWHVLARGR